MTREPSGHRQDIFVSNIRTLLDRLIVALIAGGELLYCLWWLYLFIFGWALSAGKVSYGFYFVFLYMQAGILNALFLFRARRVARLISVVWFVLLFAVTLHSRAKDGTVELLCLVPAIYLTTTALLLPRKSANPIGAQTSAP
jgi:hypothetical protein